MNSFHTQVLLKEIIENLKVEKGKKYIDATIGGGGHAVEILKRGGMVLGIDVDKDAIDYVKKILRNKDIKKLSKKKDEAHNISISQYLNITLARGNFRNIDKIAQENGFDHVKRGYGKVSGIIFDLGVSSHQLETAERGFSFQRPGPLDMRMDQDLRVKALDLTNILTKGELYELFTKFGEESRSGELVRRIVRARRMKPIETTEDLVQIVDKRIRGRNLGVHPATRIFQALRIAVNDELNALKEALPKALKLLDRKARLMVISFHSLEDRIVKHSFVDFERKDWGKIVTKKPITPGSLEVERNKRSRSAKLRVFERN